MVSRQITVNKSPWNDCGNIQCAQSHEALEAIMDCLGIEFPKDVYIVGKAVRIAEEIARLKHQIKKQTP